jgi:hypothetical protein
MIRSLADMVSHKRKVGRMGDSWKGFKLSKSRSGFLAPAFFLFLIPSVFWGTSVFQVVTKADQSCRAIDASIKSNAVSIEYLVETASDGPATWTRFDAPEDAQKAASVGYLRNAKVYLNNTLPVRVDLELKSPSKEWVHYVRYYFRQDGTLEKSHSDFRRFGAYEKDKSMDQEFLVKVLRDKYYDSMGKMVRKGSPRFFNMSTMREMKEVVYKDGPWPIYSQTKQLPFYGILQPLDPPEKPKH